MPLPNTRRLRDASLAKSKVFPRPGTTIWCDSYDALTSPVYLPIDIRPAGPYRPEETVVYWEIMAAPSLADGQSITFTLLASDSEQGPYSALDASISTTVTGTSGQGVAARSISFRLPPDCPRYLVTQMTTDAGAGDPSADGWLTFGLEY